MDMKKRFGEKQIIGFLHEYEFYTPVPPDENRWGQVQLISVNVYKATFFKARPPAGLCICRLLSDWLVRSPSPGPAPPIPHFMTQLA